MESDRLPDAVDLVFKGVDGAEAESFIRSVQRAARTEGRIRDNAWIADLVSTCMIGEALRWYVELDEDTQNDWKLLRKAILRQYPSRIQPSVPSSLPSVPTSAAATTPRNSTSLFRPSQAPKAIYRILLYFPSVEGAFFLSTDDKAQACLTKHDGRALNVHWTPGTALRLVRNGLETGEMIGLIWHSPKSDGNIPYGSPSSVNDFALLFVWGSQGNIHRIEGYSGAAIIIGWSLDQDGWLRSYSTINQVSYQTQFYTEREPDESKIQARLPLGPDELDINDGNILAMKLELI